MVNNVSITPYCISQNTGTQFIGQQISYYHSVTSTNEIAKQEAERKTREGSVIISSAQSSGKGRLNRIWSSPPGSLSLSIVLYPELLLVPYLIMSSSLAVVHAIKLVCGLRAHIKWPNDILINKKKVCGILIENSLKGNVVQYSVIGIGININVNISDYPEIMTTATSLSGETGGLVSIANISQHLLAQFETLYLAGEGVFEEWQNNLVNLGKKVRATSGNTIIDGVAESVNRHGSLLIRQADGTIVEAHAGEVTLRP